MRGQRAFAIMLDDPAFNHDGSVVITKEVIDSGCLKCVDLEDCDKIHPCCIGAWAGGCPDKDCLSRKECEALEGSSIGNVIVVTEQ